MGIQEITAPELKERLEAALQARKAVYLPGSAQALRLFNGFTEGYPDLVVELFGKSLLIFDHSRTPQAQDPLVQGVMEFYLQNVPGIEAVIIKRRYSSILVERKGMLVYGRKADTRIHEHGIWYAIDLMMNQDASFYVDTRFLRAWLQQNSAGQTVFNTFAYTGSLGVAALAGGAEHVTQIDRSGKFLALAQESARLNPLEPGRMECKAVDFFVAVGQMKKAGRSFDTVILDPPYFSITERGRVDQVNEATRLVNKARPLVKDGGRLIVVNNALFLSGKQFMDALEEMGRDGYVTVEEIIPVPEDVTGYPDTRIGRPPADPAPFNHSTKIAVLRVRRKQPKGVEIQTGGNQ